LVQNGHDEPGSGAAFARPCIPMTHPAGSQTLRPAQDKVEERSNPVRALSSMGVGANHRPHEGRIAQEANAQEKVQGYADVGTVDWKVEPTDGVQAMPVNDGWNNLPWFTLEQDLFRLQKRIYRASQRDDFVVLRNSRANVRGADCSSGSATCGMSITSPPNHKGAPMLRTTSNSCTGTATCRSMVSHPMQV
jgi:hypothetical protein